jgi:hypothetical protein
MTRPGRHAASLQRALGRSLDDGRRAALAFIGGEAWAARRSWALRWLRDQPAQAVAEALAADLVDQLFLKAVETSETAEQLPPSLVERLTTRRLAVVVDVMRQEHVLADVSNVLDELGVAHAVMKGALVRHFLYAKPYLRPSADVDVLVAPGEPPRIVRALKQRGYELTVAAHSDTHEIWLQKLGAGLDLHWSLMRPGRMRKSLSKEILERRVRRGKLWSPCDAHLTTIMLVHPAITDHVTARLVSAVDLDRWLRHAEVPWDEVIEVLDRIGLRTAAWAMLLWTQALLGTPVPADVWRRLGPDPVRRRYLEAWLGRHPAGLYARRPNLVRGFFSLALQDQARGAARAVLSLARKKRIGLGRTGDS